MTLEAAAEQARVQALFLRRTMYLHKTVHGWLYTAERTPHQYRIRSNGEAQSVIGYDDKHKPIYRCLRGL